MILAAILLSVVVGTWNGNWFPSGRAEHRAHPDVEAATAKAAGEMLADGLRTIDPSGTNDVILVLNEIRGPRSASNLVARIGRKGLRVVSISAYRRRDRFDQQQDVIATTLPVIDSGWSLWKNHRKETPPRGYSFASLVVDGAVTAKVYAVHLKSNYGATTPEAAEQNRIRRSHAADQLLAQEKSSPFVIVAGDMNADPWRKEFRDETLFADFAAGGFSDFIALLPENRRGTHPNRRYGDSALDHVFGRGFSSVREPCIVPNHDLSDHFALFTLLTPVRVTVR